MLDRKFFFQSKRPLRDVKFYTMILNNAQGKNKYIRILKGHWKGPNFVIIVSTRGAKKDIKNVKGAN